MKNYMNSDYALNKFSKGMVYRFATGAGELTLEAFLASDPNLTERDFQYWKALSDADYLTQANGENVQTYKNVPFDELEETELCSVPSPEAAIACETDTEAVEKERLQRRERLTTANSALDKLTDIQRRRYLLHTVRGLTMRQIAAKEDVGHTKIQRSIEAAEKKIKKFISSC